MKSKFVKRLLTAFMVMTSVIVFSSCERIDAGCEGIKVNLYGDDKGVGDVALVSGRVWYNPFTTEVEEFEKVTEDYLREVLARENFALGEMTSGLKYPESLEASITAKNKAVQDALKIENEIKSVEAEGKKQVAAATKAAEALKIKGDAEAEYNRKISASLSPLIVQQNFVDRWDGKLPTYSTVPQLFKDVAGK